MAFVESNSRTSGVLVSHRHVISGASSLREWSDDSFKWIPKKDLKRVLVTLGMLRFGGDYSNKIQASKIALHPNSEVYHSDKHATINFAIITLKKSVNFDDDVKPACIWSSNENVEDLKNFPMYVVGYGNDEHGRKSNLRKYAKVTPLDNDDCDAAFPHSTEQTFMSKSTSFCIRGSEKGNPCHEDESLFIKSNGIWYFRGFTVFRQRFNNPEICEITPILFEDVKPYTEWIKEEILKY
jgi:hypothetical protein